MVDALEIVRANLLSPIVLAFLLGMVARLVNSDLSIPESLVKFFSIYLLFHIGLAGGVMLAEADIAAFVPAALAALAIATMIAFSSFGILRYVARFSPADAAAIAAHYASVSTVTYIAGMDMLKAMQVEPEGFMPALLALSEWGLIVSLLIAQFAMRQKEGGTSLGLSIKETLSGQVVILLFGGMAMGVLIGEQGYAPIEPLMSDLFRVVLIFFLLEMGMDAAKQLRQFARKSGVLVLWGTLAPLVHGIFGTFMGTLVGLSPGGSFILGVIAASASYIDAPAAVRSAIPSANPSLYLTSSLGITLPFNLIVNLPLIWYLTLVFSN